MTTRLLTIGSAIDQAALSTIRRHTKALFRMPKHSLSLTEAREIVRVGIAALEHITEPRIRRRALVNVLSCAQRHESYRAELHAQV